MNTELLESVLKEKIAKYDLELDRLKAVTEIQNLMGRYECVHLTPEEIWRTPDLFALWRPDCTVEVSLQGLIHGPEDITKYWKSMKAHSIKATAFFHPLCTPVIQVAGDCKTAKATWVSNGFECATELQEGRPAFNMWCMGKYALDFIRHPETGEWKIWHFHWFRLSRNDYDKSFTDYAQFIHDHPMPARPPEDDYEVLPYVYHRTLSITEDTHPFPVDPQPYEIYDGNFNWQYGDEQMQKRYGVELKPYEKIYNVNYPEVI